MCNQLGNVIFDIQNLTPNGRLTRSYARALYTIGKKKGLQLFRKAVEHSQTVKWHVGGFEELRGM